MLSPLTVGLHPIACHAGFLSWGAARDAVQRDFPAEQQWGVDELAFKKLKAPCDGSSASRLSSPGD